MTAANSPLNCPACRGSGQQYYQARDGECVLAACPACGSGLVGSIGSGLAPAEGIPAGQWACLACGAAWFGTAPDDGLCGDCQAAGGAR